MRSTRSSATGAAGVGSAGAPLRWQPPLRAADSATSASAQRARCISPGPGRPGGKARLPGSSALWPRQLRPDTVLELPYRILLRYEHALLVWQGVQPALVDLTDLRVFAHLDVGEFHRARDVALRLRQRLGQEQELNAHLGKFRSERQQAHDAHVINVGHDEYRGHAGKVEVSGLAVCLVHLREQYPDGITVHGPGLRAVAQAARELRILIGGMVLPGRIVTPLEQRAAEDRHQLRKLGVYVGAVQALVVVFPEDLPVALDCLAQRVADSEAPHLPVIEAREWQVKALGEGGRIVGEGDEDEAIPV